MYVLINGLPLFAARLSDDLSKLETKVKYIYCDTYNSKWQFFRYLFLLPFAKGVISLNGVSDKSKTLSAALFFKKKIIMQWQGTDTTIALDRKKDGTIFSDYLENSIHFSDAPWLQEEVELLGYNCENLLFKHVKVSRNSTKRNKIQFMSYVAESRQAFYGMKEIITMAENFPDIVFKIVGTQKSDYDLPVNVKCLGWVKEREFAEILKESSTFLRLVEHDGLSASCIEALGYGCDVVWSLPWKYAEKFNLGEDNTQMIKTLIQKIENRNLEINQQNIDRAAEDFNFQKIISEYDAKIFEVLTKN